MFGTNDENKISINNAESKDYQKNEKKIRVIFHKRIERRFSNSVNIHIDGKYIATITGDESVEVELSPGSHRVIFENMWMDVKDTNIIVSEKYSTMYVDFGIKRLYRLAYKIIIFEIKDKSNDEIPAYRYENRCNIESVAYGGKMNPVAITSFVISLICCAFIILPIAMFRADSYTMYGAFWGVLGAQIIPSFFSVYYGILAKKHIKAFPDEKGNVIGTLGLVIGGAVTILALIAIIILLLDIYII